MGSLRKSDVRSDAYTIAEMSASGWTDRAGIVLGREDPLTLARGHQRQAAAERARAAGKHHDFKSTMDEETRRSLFPSNYPRAAVG